MLGVFKLGPGFLWIVTKFLSWYSTNLNKLIHFYSLWNYQKTYFRGKSNSLKLASYQRWNLATISKIYIKISQLRICDDDFRAVSQYFIWLKDRRPGIPYCQFFFFSKYGNILVGWSTYTKRFLLLLYQIPNFAYAHKSSYAQKKNFFLPVKVI